MARIFNSIFVVILTSFSLIARPVKSNRNTGSFSELVYDAGNTYGYKIIIYECSGHWAVFHDADTYLPIVVPASIKNGYIEFTVPSDNDATTKRTFNGKITKTHLVGKFDNSDSIIKLRRGQL